jgi:hypothetical protein
VTNSKNVGPAGLRIGLSRRETEMKNTIIQKTNINILGDDLKEMIELGDVFEKRVKEIILDEYPEFNLKHFDQVLSLVKSKQ